MGILYCFRPNLEQVSLDRLAFFLDCEAADRLQAYFKACPDEVQNDSYLRKKNYVDGFIIMNPRQAFLNM